MIQRNLDGVYFRVERDGKWQNICFSDLTEDEMDSVLGNWNEDQLRRMCKVLGMTIKGIGDQFDIAGE